MSKMPVRVVACRLLATTHTQRVSVSAIAIGETPSQTDHTPATPFDDLDAALDEQPPVDDRLVHSVPLSAVKPSGRNPRQHVDGIAELADSMREHGLLQPIVVRRHGGEYEYELVAGHRRFEAARTLGWREIAAVVRDETDQQAYILTLVENLQREDLSPKEEAAALEVLVRERGWTTRQVGEAIKRDHSYVSRRLRVFDDPVLAPLVLDRKLPVSTAEELLRVRDPQTRQDLAGRAADADWTWSDARKAISEIGAARTNWAELARHLNAALEVVAQVDPATLRPADRKLIRSAVAALRGLTRNSGG